MLPFNPQPKTKAVKSVRVKQTQRQKGDISPSVTAELLERSQGVCERCGRARATERAHITGRKQIDWQTTAADLLHLCTACHKWLDGTPEGIQTRRMFANVINYLLGKANRF